MKTKKTSTLSDKIADSLREAINYGTLKPSDKIIERELAEKYEASHIPVREALRILEGEGFMVHRKFAGYTVREVNPEEMIELYNIMRFLTVLTASYTSSFSGHNPNIFRTALAQGAFSIRVSDSVRMRVGVDVPFFRRLVRLRIKY